MPEKTCFPHLLGTDIEHIVPSLDMELDFNHMMDHDLTMVDNGKLRQIQDVLCEPLPMSPAMGIQHGNNFQKHRSHSTGGDIHAEHWLFSPDETHSCILQDLMQTGSSTDISGIIPIYNHPINSSNLIVNSPPTSKGYHIPQPQHTTSSFGSLLFAPSDDLLNIECSSALDGFPSQAVVSAGNSLITDNCDTQWAEQLINAPTNVNNTAASVFKVPSVPTSNQKYSFNNPGPRRISSWPHIEHELEIEEPASFSSQQYGSGQVCYKPSNNLMDNCSLINQQQTANLPRENNYKTVKKSTHRRTSSDTNLMQFFNIWNGPHNPQLLPNETFNLPFAEQTQQHQQHPTHTSNKHASGGSTERKRSFKRKQKKQVGTHPYPHCFHNTNYTTQTSAINNGAHNTSSFSPLPYPTTSSSAYCTNSPKVVHSQSVPNSPSIQRAAEPSPPATNLRQQFGAPIPTTNSTSNFTFDNVVLTATPTHISLNSGTSQEARDEKEKTEAFSRLHQGLHLWEFLMEILLTNEYQPILKWTDKENGVFKIVDSEALARFWGEYRRKPKMNYDKMSRAIRYYYGKDILDKAPKRLYYQFKYHSHWWEKLQKVDASFKINHIPVSDIPAPNVQDLIIPDDL